MNLGQAIARELQVPFYVSPMERDGRYVSWWEQDQCAELGRLLEQCRAAVVVTGDTLSPIPFHRPRPGEGPADLDLHWKRLLRSHDELVRASPRSAHIGIRRLHEAGRLAGAIAEVGDGLIEATGIPPALVADIHGSVHTVRCIRCRAEGPAAPFVEPYRRTHEIPRCDCGGSLRPTAIELGEGVDRGATERAHRFIENADLLLTLGTDLEIDPSASSLIEAARSRRIPYVIVSYRGTRFDDGAALAIQGSADENLALAMRRLAS
jgi:NAD-dependent SIR2 family protein deacetylase